MTVHLGIKSNYSLLESSLSVFDIVQLAKENHMTSIALCDHNVMYGSIAFYRACQKANIKPIIGLEADIQINEEIYPFLFIAKNNQGYRALLEISTYLNTQSSSISPDKIQPYQQHLIVICYGEKGYLETDLIRKDQEEGIKKILFLRSFFKNLYLGISSNEQSFWRDRNELFRTWGRLTHTDSVALTKIRYKKKENSFVLKALTALSLKTNVYDDSLGSFENLHFHTNEEMEYLYQKEELLNTEKIAEQCHVDIDEKHAKLLNFPIETNHSPSEYLKQLCLLGLQKRFQKEKVPVQYHTRLMYELSVIHKMKYDDYFLIVWDVMRYAKKQNILVGAGRGSAAGSIVAWTLGITHVDPIKYGLLFERFLNPERISMPDIDMDFQDDRRGEIISYLSEKYGTDKVAHIIAFSTLKARAALDSAMDAFGVHKKSYDYIKKYLPRDNQNKAVLSKVYEENLHLRQLVQSDDRLQQIYHLAIQLEGIPRNITTHACGIVMSNMPLTEVIPLTNVDDTLLSTQISAEYLEDLGLLKMDFLAIRNLTIIQKVCSHIHPSVDIMKIPFDDSMTYQLIQNGDTSGIFQLESDGMRNLIMRMKPNNLSEISDALALYRPGPMDNISLYLKNKENPQLIQYPHPNLIPILKDTYGVVIYQEQIMQIAQVAAGFSLGKADILRRAVSKKKESEILNLKNEFIEGCRRNKYEDKVSESLFDLILKFAGYGFNKSHSIAYSVVAYQMCYLKARYPLFFFQNLLDNVIGIENKTAEYLQECRKRKVDILPVSVQHSSNHYTIENNALRMPLRCIKKIGSNTVNDITSDRENRGVYKDFFDFVARMNMCKVNQGVIESLIDAGALDDFKINRASLHASLSDAMRYAELIKVDNPEQGYLDFDLVYKPAISIVKEDHYDRLDKEKEVLGFYLSKHPISVMKENIQYKEKSIAQLQPSQNRTSVLVHIQKIKVHQAKTGNMVFLTVDDESGSMDAVVFPQSYERYKEYIKKGNFVYLYGRLESGRTSAIQCVVDKISPYLNDSSQNHHNF